MSNAETSKIEPPLPPMHNRAICTQDKKSDCGPLRGLSSRQAQIPATVGVLLEEECILIEDRADNLNRRRSRWNHEPVPIFQNHLRQAANGVAGGGKVQHNPSRRPRLAQAGHQALIRRHHRTLRAVLIAALPGLTLHARDRSPFNEMFEMIGILVQPLLLEFLSTLARELGARRDRLSASVRRRAPRAIAGFLQD